MSGFYLPKFQDGETLSEKELFELAASSLELFRLNNTVNNRVGFCHLPDTSSAISNQFILDMSHRTLQIANLFVISPEGIPFVFRGQCSLSLPEHPSQLATLYASLFWADSSEAYAHQLFADDAYETGSYQLDFCWDAPSEPMAGSRLFSVPLAELRHDLAETQDDARVFLLQPAHSLSALTPLYEKVTALGNHLDSMMDLLLEPSTFPGIDRTVLLDRLELYAQRLRRGIPVRSLILEAKLPLEAIRALLLRINYALHPQDPTFQACYHLEGRLLEHALLKLWQNRSMKLHNILAAELATIAKLLDAEPDAAYEQIEFFESFVTWANPDRLLSITEHLSRLIGPAAAPPPQGDRDQQQTSQSQERPKQRGPKIIDLKTGRSK